MLAVWRKVRLGGRGNPTARSRERRSWCSALTVALSLVAAGCAAGAPFDEMDTVLRSLEPSPEWHRVGASQGGDGPCSWGPGCAPNSGRVYTIYRSPQEGSPTCRALADRLVGEWAQVEEAPSRFDSTCRFEGPVGEFYADIVVLDAPSTGSEITVEVRMCPSSGGYC